ncbi:competence type IV pilus major pilin ComGC [Metabacillus fastidiosus]|uniref:competence type IV pilus major pilin ComGC n=1 Tax=Metabacillus fastidiosus TaxID=1458 RepID=UPI002E1E5E63|nr:competence type IV pilus major pilin ComGC [Metabacillus fastidiosus]
MPNMKNEKGFTLIEMLVVLFVITILLLMTIPNVTKHNKNIQTKGCNGLVNMVQAQVSAFQMDHNKLPTINDLVTNKYLKDDPACPNGEKLTVDSEGKVTVSAP